MRRGYYGIGIVLPKSEVNVGTLWRSAFVFGASYVFTVGRRYKKQSSDTTSSWRHMPLFHYETPEEAVKAIPYSCISIAVELHEDAQSIAGFSHPERAIYFLGPEDGSVPKAILEHCVTTIQIPGRFCLNVAVAGSIVMYDREAKSCRIETSAPAACRQKSPALNAVAATTASRIASSTSV